jgi:uncharacterized protein (TIGR00288 family)
MTTAHLRAPHQGSLASVQPGAPNAALLIDFDNVTMGMRSDLSKDLRKLLQSDIIRGKVTVQRAYADWRRYPQYIVPLSENSIDLIFAPAYGSSKKNATDIRMAIDGMELVFTRPEIGTFILLTGDSDFSSLVLKLKEYGKYVIGVEIQESSSDILVQNCDEYYSYTNLAGLQKTSETDQKPTDPWVLVERAVRKMAERDDVMRSDRLKQVMIELDPAFNEGNFGFSKFSRFVTEAASRNLLRLRKLDNGQYEVTPGDGQGGGRAPASGRGRGERDPERDRDRDRRGRRGGRNGREPRSADPEPPVEPPQEAAPEDQEASPPVSGGGAAGDPLHAAYDLLRRAVEAMTSEGREAVRDSDAKRRLLTLDPSFDEAELGFSKFSKFLRQARDHGVIDLRTTDEGNLAVSLPGGSAEGDTSPVESSSGTAPDAVEPDTIPAAEDEAERRPPVGSDAPTRLALRARRGSTRRRGAEGAPELLEGQAVSLAGGTDASVRVVEALSSPPTETVDPATLGLPTDRDAAIRYLTNSYKGVGAKTAVALVDELGDGLFQVLHSDPSRIATVVPPARADAVLEAWAEDYRRRSASLVAGETPSAGSSAPRRTRRTRRGRRS